MKLKPTMLRIRQNIARATLRLFPLLPLFLPLSSRGAVVYDWVEVGNPGNAADSTGYGAVAYTYHIGKYEVTNAQYTAFLNKVDPAGSNPNGIYNMQMGTDARGGIAFNPLAAPGSRYSIRTNMGDKPVNFVNWYDAARFANWMHNGQGVITETGAYTLSGNVGQPARNSNAIIWLPSENEWYKAAYHDPSPDGPAGADDYWLYATRSDTLPTIATATDIGNIANPGNNVANLALGADWNFQDGNVTTVGSAGPGSASYYGTFDQSGNIYEWNEAVTTFFRGLRGGSYGDPPFDSGATARFQTPSEEELDSIGFRLAGIPEPSTAVLLGLAVMATAWRRSVPFRG